MKVILKNCQVWPYFELDLRPSKIMLPRAENDEGKSVWIKVFKCAMLGSYKGRSTFKSIVRKDTTHAFISLTMDDGRVWEATISHKEIVHRVYSPNSKVPEVYYAFDKPAPTEVTNFLGVYVNPKINYVSWIIDPEDMLVGINTTPSQTFEVFHPILRPQEIVEKRQAFQEGLKESQTRIQQMNKVIENTSNLLQKTPYVDTTDVELRIKKIEEALVEIDTLLKPLDSFIQLKTILDSLPNLDSQEIQTLLGTAQVLHIHDNLHTLPKLDSNEISTLLTTAEVLHLISNLNGIKFLSTEEISTLLTTVELLYITQQLEALPNLNKQTLRTLELTAEVLYLKESIEQLSKYNQQELTLLTNVAEALHMHKALESLSNLDKGEIETLELVCTIIKYKIGIEAHTKNLRIIQNSMNTLNTNIHQFKQQMSEEDKKTICPNCGYHLGEEK